MTSVQQPKKKHTFVSLLLAFVLPFTLVFGVQYFFFKNYWVPSASMENTLMTGDKVFGTLLINYTPTRGDIIVFKDDKKWFNAVGDQNIVKRVIGVEGDVVECCSEDGRIVINGVPIDEPYIVGENEFFAPQTVPEGHIFVLGDNREHSADSRSHIEEGTQFINEKSLLSRVWAIWSPHIELIS